jgi:hypothetical protein
LRRIPSAQTLVGSVSDISQVQHGSFANQGVQSTWDLNREYPGESLYVELPGSSNFGEHLLFGTTSGTSEEHDNDIGSFFRAWRESQTERREQGTESDQ